MSSPLTRLKQSSPEERAKMIQFLEKQLAQLRQEMKVVMVTNPSRMVELGVAAQNVENELRRLRGR